MKRRLDWFKLKTIIAEILKLAKMPKFVLDGVENIVGKGENPGYHYFLLFPQGF